MRLFHGSLDRVEVPCIMPRELYRPLDLGVGFYTTTDVEQALRWVQIRLGRNPMASSGCVMEYDFDESLLVSDELKVKKFDGISIQWLNFIAANRLHGNVDHSYDIVMGPVADDRVYTVLNLYEGGFIDEVDAMKRMKAYRLADQVLFHTERSLRGLRYLATMEEKFTQEDIRTILPSKIALLVDILSKRTGEDPVKLMTDFYQSKTYAMLQNESTKYWWFGPAELCELFEQDVAQMGSKNL